ncbi:MAG: phage holin [Firmicutes bacterium]|nr:phage holin [[Eubacterium] siraeum]MCM1488633.1 phage holin [Bacillota bacterium]
MIDITPIINGIIALVAAIITAFLIPWIKSKTTDSQRQQFVAWVKIAVAAAEQIYNGTGRGAEKKQFVIDFLEDKGLTFDKTAVDAAIEAAVKQLNSDGITIS